MKKTILIYGLIAGFIASLMMAATLIVGLDNMGSVWSMVLGFTGMIIAFAFFVGVAKYRDKINNGAVSFGNAFLIGLGISLIASTMYVLVWMAEYKYMYPDFIEKYAAHSIEMMKKNGATQPEIDKATIEMADMAVKYKNDPLYRAGVTYTEILPLGILASLIAAVALRRKPKPIGA